MKLGKSASFRRGKLILRRLAGRELWFQPEDTSQPISLEGWLYEPSGLHSGSVVYSLGVGDDIGFELELIRRCHLQVHAFDPTPGVATWLSACECLPDRLQFHPWAAAGRDGTLTLYPRPQSAKGNGPGMFTALHEDGTAEGAVIVPAYSLATLCETLGHRHIDLLKIDIEGAEYDVLDSMLGSSLRPIQLLIEFHHRFNGVGLWKTADMVERLVMSGYELLGVSDAGREYCFRLSRHPRAVTVAQPASSLLSTIGQTRMPPSG